MKQLIPAADTETRALWLSLIGEDDVNTNDDSALLSNQLISAVADIISGANSDATNALLSELSRLDASEQHPDAVAEAVALGKQLAALTTKDISEAYSRSVTLHKQLSGQYADIAEACAGCTLNALALLNYDFTGLDYSELKLLHRLIELHIQTASDDAIFELRDLGTWPISLPTPDLLILDLRILHSAARRKQALRRARARITPKGLINRSIQEDRLVVDKFGIAFSIWVDTFRITTPDFRSVLARWRLSRRVPPALVKRFRQYNETRMNSAKRLDLIAPWLERRDATDISDDLAYAAGVDLTDPVQFTLKLVDRFSDATNNEERAIVFKWWRQGKIRNTDAITMFVDKVYLPTVRLGNAGAYAMARQTLDTLSKNAGGRKREISRTTLKFAPTKKESQRAKKSLKKSGFNVPKKWVLF